MNKINKLIKNYAHDHRGIKFEENDLEKLLECFSIELMNNLPLVFKKEILKK